MKIKPLHWYGEHHREYAYALFGGSYSITRYAGMAKPYQLEKRGFDGSLQQPFATLEAARAAAKADYESRILSAIEPAPDLAAENARLREALSGIKTVAAQAHRHRSNAGKEAMFLAVIEQRADAALNGDNT